MEEDSGTVEGVRVCSVKSTVIIMCAVGCRITIGTGCRACPLTTLCQEEPKHRNNLRALYRFTERFGAFEHAKLFRFRKEEERSKRKIKKKNVLLDFSQ
jgi:hypothetical protein